MMKRIISGFLLFSSVIGTLSINADVITQAQINQFHQDGFLVIENFISTEECDELRNQIAVLLDEFDPNTVKSIFTTDEQQRYVDDYFYDSADKIRFFFEKDAFREDGSLRYAKELSINKAAHALHERDPVFSAFSRQSKFQDLASDLNVIDPILIQSMYIFKQPKIGGEVNWHQDATFLQTEPQTLIGLWFALEDATIENGCLWAIPGGHRGALKKRYVRNENNQCEFEEIDSTEYETSKMVPLPVKKGALVIIDGLVPHMSSPNRSSQSRHAYSIHFYDGRSEWSRANWLQRPADNPASGF